MAASQTSNKETEATGDLSDIKRKLAWRMGIAGLMIVALLGGLALFDYLGSSNTTESSAPQFTEPVPVAKKTITQPVTPVESVPEVPKEEKASAPESSSVPEDKAAPALEPPQRPAIAANPALPRTVHSTAPTVASDVVSLSPPVVAPPKALTAPARVPESKVATMPAHVEPSGVEKPAQPSPPRLFAGFALQAGVFSDPHRAEELHAKLTLEGIPSTIEARVQVGPFKNRAEAEEARSKLKALGIEAVMLPQKKNR